MAYNKAPTKEELRKWGRLSRIKIQNAPKHILTIIFGLLVKPDRHFISVFWNLFT